MVLVVVTLFCSWSWQGLARGHEGALARGLSCGRLGLAGGFGVFNLVRLKPVPTGFD